MLELSGWVSVGSFVSRSQPGAFLFVSSVFRRMGVAQKRFLVFVTRSGGFPTSSFVKGSRCRWSMALRAVLLAHSSLNAFCIEIHFGIPTFQVLSRPYLRSCYRDCLREALHET